MAIENFRIASFYCRHVTQLNHMMNLPIGHQMKCIQSLKTVERAMKMKRTSFQNKLKKFNVTPTTKAGANSPIRFR